MIASPRLSAELLAHHLPWKTLETLSPVPNGFDHYATCFDLGVGEHDRVDRHLEAVKDALLAQQRELDALLGECKYALWVYYDFPIDDGAFNLFPSILAAFAFLRVEVIFHLHATPKA
jgi:hypothetical protein